MADRTIPRTLATLILMTLLATLASLVIAPAAQADPVSVSASVVQVNPDKVMPAWGMGTSIAAQTCSFSSPRCQAARATTLRYPGSSLETTPSDLLCADVA